MGPGQHFGEVELLHKNPRAIASIKATLQSAVEVISLERDIFVELMTEAQAMRDRLWEVVEERLTQNLMTLHGQRRLVYA